MVYLLKIDIEKLCHHPIISNCCGLCVAFLIMQHKVMHTTFDSQKIFWQLHKEGELSHLWVLRELDKLKNLAGDIPKLLSNMARIRTWNYIAQRPDWLPNNEYWQPHLKELENKLSQTVHERLTERFVDEMGHVSERATPKNVTCEGEELWCQSMRLGILDALSFVSSSTAQGKFGFQTVRSLGREHFSATVQAVYRKILQHNKWDINESFELCYDNQPLAELRKGSSIREPSVRFKAMDLLDAKQKRQIELHLLGWLKNQIQSVFSIYQGTDEQTREIRYDLRQHLGSIPLHKHNRPNKGMRRKLGKVGIVCGKHHLYHRDIYNSKHQWVRFVLYALWHSIPILPTLPEHRVCIQTRW